MDWKELGATIRKARENRGLYQYDLAKLLDVSPEMISYYESGKKKISFDKLKIICRVTGLDINTL